MPAITLSQFTSLNLGTATTALFQTFATNLAPGTSANSFVKQSFQNYIVHIDQIQQALNDGTIDSPTAVQLVTIWNGAMKSSVAAAQQVQIQAIQNALNAVLQQLVNLIGAALDTTIKAAVAA